MNINWYTLSDLYQSDHFPIIIQLPEYATHGRKRPRWIIEKADWANYTSFINKNNLVEGCNDINSLVEKFTETLITAATVTIPKTNNCVQNKSVPWWTSDIKAAIKAKRKALRIFNRSPTAENLSNFRRNRAIARLKVRKAKQASWQEFVSQITSDTPSAIIFKKIRAISGNYKTNTIQNLLVNNNTITHPYFIANEIGKSMQHTSSSSNYSIQFQTYKTQAELTNLNISSINDEEYNSMFSNIELTKSLNNCKGSSPGIDEIHYDMIKHLDIYALDHLLYIYNTIWAQHIIPTSWLTSLIIPILKPGKPQTDSTSYRPIALTSCLLKVMEGMVNARLIWILEKYGHLDNRQYGFRRNRSTLDPILIMESAIQDAFLSRKMCVAVFFDIKKAYDMVWRYHIIKELYDMGIRGNLIHFVKSFLRTRSFKVMVGDNYSDIYEQENGIPQGSKLSVTLFLIGINSILKSVKEPVEALLFADDLVIYMTGSNAKKIEKNLQNTLNQLSKWSEKNGLQFAPDKMTMMQFSRLRRQEQRVKLTLNGAVISYSENKKFLGIHFDKRLTWKKHIQETYNSTIKQTNILKILANRNWGANEDSLLSVYKSIVRSRLEYGCVAFQSAKPHIIQKLQLVQNLSIRISMGAYRTSPVISIHSLSGIQPLNNRRNQFNIIAAIKIINNQNHPLNYLLTSEHPLQNKYNNRKIVSKPFSIRAKELMSTYNVNITPSPETSISILPPWKYLKLEVNKKLDGFGKNHTNPVLYRNLFLEEIHKYPDYIHYYTDGSKQNDEVGCAFVETNVANKYHLPTNCNIFTAELFAIFKAIESAILKDQCKILIITDSMSAIQALQKTITKNYIVQDIQKTISNYEHLFVTFFWVPSHQGIAGNEMADREAVSSTLEELVNISIPEDNLISLTKIKIFERWKHEWNCITNNKLRAIKPGTAKWINKYSRKEATTINRLRIGHCNLTHQYIFKRELPPVCTNCQKPLTIKHILIECKNYDNHRVEVKLSDALEKVLGDTNSDMIKLIKFLKKINLFNEI